MELEKDVGLVTDCTFSSYFSCFGLLVDTSWFKVNDGSSLPHECRLHLSFECYILPDISYHNDAHE